MLFTCRKVKLFSRWYLLAVERIYILPYVSYLPQSKGSLLVDVILAVKYPFWRSSNFLCVFWRFSNLLCVVYHMVVGYGSLYSYEVAFWPRADRWGSPLMRGGFWSFRSFTPKPLGLDVLIRNVSVRYARLNPQLIREFSIHASLPFWGALGKSESTCVSGSYRREARKLIRQKNDTGAAPWLAPFEVVRNWTFAPWVRLIYTALYLKIPG